MKDFFCGPRYLARQTAKVGMTAPAAGNQNQENSKTMKTTFRNPTTKLWKLRRFLSTTLAAACAVLADPAGAAAQTFTKVNRTNAGIIDFSPGEGAIGQQIVVTVSQTSLVLNTPPPDISPDNTVIQFQGAGTTFINAPTTRIGTTTYKPFPWSLTISRRWTYSVTVPNGARTGPLRLVRGSVLGTTSNSFTVRTTGITVGNLAQYNIIGIQVDGIERLAPQTLQATAPTSPTLFVADIGAAAGNHVVAVTLGIGANQPIMKLTSASVPAQNPFFELPVNPITMAQFLPFRANSNSFGFASWQGVTIDPVNLLPVIHGFDFTFNSATGRTSYTFWANNNPAQPISTGTVEEPASWPLNAQNVSFRLIRSNGAVDFTVNMNMVTSSFTGPFGEPCVRQP